MPEFNVTVTVRLEVGAQLTVTAKTEEKAQEKVQALIDSGMFAISWSMPQAEKAGAECEEADQTADVEEASEV